MGGLLYLSLSSGWSKIKCHLLIKMFLRFCKEGWYVVTKGRNFFRTSLFFCEADFRSVNLTSEVIFFYEIVRVTSSAKAFFEVVDVFIEGFSWRVSSEIVRATGREMRVLKSLCRFKMCCGCQGFLGCEISFPSTDSRKNSFCFFPAPWGHQLSPKIIVRDNFCTK